ncbi:MAG: M48 family metalloprotease [Cyclobacteriaceae bacterium]
MNRYPFENADRRTKEFAWEICQNQHDKLEGDLKRGKFMLNSILTDSLQSILNDIKKANHDIPDDLVVLVVRDNDPNATNFGNGIIGVNLGLLVRLENLQQLNFILCHEIAHTLAGHMSQTIDEVVKLNLDKDINNRLGKARNQTYNRYTSVQRILVESRLKRSMLSKRKEYEADSIGLKLYLNQTYNAKHVIRCLELLDSIDISFDDRDLDFRKIFDMQEYPFKDSWTSYTKANTWHRSIDSIYPDSLRSHPKLQGKNHGSKETNVIRCRRRRPGCINQKSC